MKDEVLEGYCLLMLTKTPPCVCANIAQLMTKQTYNHDEI